MINPSKQAPGAAADSSNQNLSPEEQKLMRLYGKVPKVPLARHLMGGRKYFDSGDYALAKAGDKNIIVGEDHKEVTVGKGVPLPAARVPAVRAPPRASALHQSTTSRLKEVAAVEDEDEQEPAEAEAEAETEKTAETTSDAPSAEADKNASSGAAAVPPPANSS